MADVSANAIRDRVSIISFFSSFFLILHCIKETKNKDQSFEDWVQTESETQIWEYIAQLWQIMIMIHFFVYFANTA